MDAKVKEQIEQTIRGHRVVLFMKGNKSIPLCGFSGTVVQILKSHNADFETVDVLKDNRVREGIKEFANWPTIPQLYIDGEFVGGCDIVKDLNARGELATMLRKPTAS